MVLMANELVHSIRFIFVFVLCFVFPHFLPHQETRIWCLFMGIDVYFLPAIIFAHRVIRRIGYEDIICCSSQWPLSLKLETREFYLHCHCIHLYESRRLIVTKPLSPITYCYTALEKAFIGFLF